MTAPRALLRQKKILERLELVEINAVKMNGPGRGGINGIERSIPIVIQVDPIDITVKIDIQ